LRDFFVPRDESWFERALDSIYGEDFRKMFSAEEAAHGPLHPVTGGSNFKATKVSNLLYYLHFLK
jgi:hypothetical protein